MAVGILIVWHACKESLDKIEQKVKLVIEINDVLIAVVQFISVRFEFFFTDAAVDQS